MLFNIVNRRSRLETHKRYSNARNGISGVGVPIDPDKFPNLVYWAKDTGLPANFAVGCNLTWQNHLADNALQGNMSFCTGGLPNNEIGTLNGRRVLIQVDPAATCLVTPVNNTPLQLSTFTIIGILRQDSSVAGRAMWASRCSGLGGCFTYFGLQQLASGKLQFFTRADNSQTAIVDSTTVIAGAGWQIIAVSFDPVAKTATMYENGNKIQTTNAAMNTFTFVPLSDMWSLNTNALSAIGGWWVGGIGEFTIYNDVKTPGIINLLGTYYALRYNLTWLPVS